MVCISANWMWSFEIGTERKSFSIGLVSCHLSGILLGLEMHYVINGNINYVNALKFLYKNLFSTLVLYP